MISTFTQIVKIIQKIDEINKKLDAVQEDMAILKTNSKSLNSPAVWSNFSLGEK